MAIKIDETDLRILSLLNKNAKMRMHAIAKRTGMPASTVHHRIKRMEKEGVISGWTITKDYKKLGLAIKTEVLIFVDVSSLKEMGKTQEDIGNSLAKIPEVESVEIITGKADMLVTVRTQDMEGFKTVLLSKIQTIKGIIKTETMMVIGECNKLRR